jgi:predicted phosphodiesterase
MTSSFRELMPFNRMGVVGDVHACDERLSRLLGFLHDQSLDTVVCVGDIVNGPGDPNRCAALLQSHGVVTVRGNHDRWLLEGQPLPGANAQRLEDLTPSTLAFLRALPTSVELEAADGTQTLLCHGLGNNDMNGISDDDYGYALEANLDLQQLLSISGRRIVIKGHRHRPAVWRVGPLTLVDAGSLLDKCSSCGAIIDLSTGTVSMLAFTDDFVELRDTHPL